MIQCAAPPANRTVADADMIQIGVNLELDAPAVARAPVGFFHQRLLPPTDQPKAAPGAALRRVFSQVTSIFNASPRLSGNGWTGECKLAVRIVRQWRIGGDAAEAAFRFVCGCARYGANLERVARAAGRS